MTDDRNWMVKERNGPQLGPLDSILRTSGRFLIRNSSSNTFRMALQVSRNLFQYFGADSELVHSHADLSSRKGNVISIALGLDFPKSAFQFNSIQLVNNHGLFLREDGREARKFRLEEGLGAIFLRPLPNKRLELVIWGYDSWGLNLAGRLMPMLTGVGQPDFIVVSRRCAWEGAAGVLAMGLFDRLWNMSEASFIS